MVKCFLLDTNCVMNMTSCIDDDNEYFICETTLDELEAIKSLRSYDEERKFKARRAVDLVLNNEDKIKVIKDAPCDMVQSDKPDDIICYTALWYGMGLITNDKIMYLRAKNIFGIEAKPLELNSDKYKGFKRVTLSDFSFNNIPVLMFGEYLIVEADDDYICYVCIDDKTQEIEPINMDLSFYSPLYNRIEARDETQAIAMDALQRTQVTMLKGKAGCVDKDTEYFNGYEWKPISEYKDGDLVLQYDTLTCEASLTHPLRYIKKPAKEFYYLKSKYGIDQMLTGEHRVLVDYRHTKGHEVRESVYDLEEYTMDKFAERCKNKRFVDSRKFRTTFSHNPIGTEDTDDEIRFIIAMCADGSIKERKRTTSIVGFNLKKQRKKDRLEKILNSIGYEYKIYEKNNGYTEYCVVTPFEPYKQLPSRWYFMNHNQRLVFLDEIFEWDGLSSESNNFSTTDKAEADLVQFILSCENKRATIHIDNRIGGIHKSICYTVRWTKRTRIGFDGRDAGENIFEKIPSEDGYCYCFTVPTGALVLRRNNRIFITGNCGKSLLALSYLFQELNRSHIDKIYMFVNPVKTYDSQELGYYSGSRDEKLLQGQAGNFLSSHLGAMEEVERLIASEELIILPFSDIRGIDLSQPVGLYITEAQNTSISLMKLALTRAGEECKVIIDGDYETQVDRKSFSGGNNGMKRMSEVFRGTDIYSEVELGYVQRSKIAEIADRM